MRADLPHGAEPFVFAIDNPARGNALDERQLARLCSTLQHHEGAFVLTSVGPKFCSGVDLDYARSDLHASAERLFDALEALASHSDPTVAVVAGDAWGAGWLLAAACDVVVATRSAVFCLPELALGIPPFAAQATVARFFSAAQAELAIAAGRAMSGAELGAVGAVVLADQSEALAMGVGLAAELARPAPMARRALKPHRRAVMLAQLREARRAAHDFLDSSKLQGDANA